MKVVLWILQVLLAVVFLLSGVTKLLQPVAAMGQMMAWVNSVPEWMVRLSGAAEVLGAIGLVLPSLTRIQPRLTVWAAIGLMVVQVLAIGLHASLGQFTNLPVNFVLLILTAVVAFGRSRVAPIAPRMAAA